MREDELVRLVLRVEGIKTRQINAKGIDFWQFPKLPTHRKTTSRQHQENITYLIK